MLKRKKEKEGLRDSANDKGEGFAFNSLYNKYRPRNIEQLYGNQELKADLEPIFAGKKEVPHAILLSGPSGCGKTTIARIFAAFLKCESSLVELDAGADRGIETIRKIRESAKAKGFVSGGRKMFILDEVHNTTKQAQEAMLKALEDCPNHVYYVLCTTNPESLLKTILTRCTNYQVEKLSVKYLSLMMEDILEKENVQVPDTAIKSIAKMADGSSRAALVNLERIMGRHPDDMESMIHSVQTQETQVKELCQALLMRSDWKRIATLIKGLGEFEPESIRRQLLGYMANVLLSGKDSAQAAIVIDCFKEAMYNSGKAGFIQAAYYSINAE